MQQIQTTRFGVVSVTPEQLHTFPRGLIGFSKAVEFALLPAPANEGFYWLQSVIEPDLAFLVTDPAPFFKDYDVPVREETQADLQLADTKDGRLFVICNRVGEWLTGNLLGPLVINTASRTGLQVVLTEKKWTCRQPLMRLGAAEQSMMQAA
jgi:flagellar assembly factor FliW